MSNKTLLDAIEVETPCDENWNEMTGNDEVRFCSHCAKDVHNISAMTRKKARKLVIESNGRLCIRYTKRPDGNKLFLPTKFYQIARQTGIAASVLATSISISSAAYAQTTTNLNPSDNAASTESVRQAGENPLGLISGTVTDPNGAVVPFAFLTLTNQATGAFQTVNSTNEGFYEFKDVPAGNYLLKIDAAGFDSQEITRISIGGAGDVKQDAQLTIQKVQEMVTVGGEDVSGYETVSGGAMFSIVRYNKLVSAVEADNLEEVKMLIGQGARVNSKDKGYHGNSPLHAAVASGNVEITQFLLNSGAKTNSRNAEKRTPLMMLDEDATPELVNLLLRYGAKPNLVDKEGNTALIAASESAKAEVLLSLLNFGSKLDARNKNGRTALMTAVDAGNLESVKFLLGAGANVNLRDSEGKSALVLAENTEIKQSLIVYGATE